MDQSVNVVYNADVSGYTQSLGEAMAATERMMQIEPCCSGDMVET